MAEDPDLSRQRIEHQQLRRQLNEVFGPFEQFCEYVAGTNSAGSSGIMRHGVVQIPTTPVLSSRSALPSSAPSTSSAAQQSTQQLLQSMQNLVTSPIQPLHGLPFSCNRDYLNTAPSSSTHSAPEGNEVSAKKGKRNRTMDSDSEVEKEKRRRRKEDSKSSGMPGTSRSNTHSSNNSDGLRALFGDGADRKDPPDKGISPDSGVHSAENDPGDENDVHSAQTIINLITKLSPPLSPIKQRPSDKKAERERREVELKERERRAREREETVSFIDVSDRNDRSLERKERTRPAESEKVKTSGGERKRDDSIPRIDGLQGEIILKGLDRSKLNQLFEIGRRTGRMKCLPRASSSQSHDGVEQASSHSRPSSAVSNHPSRSGFECVAHECAPTRPARPVKPEEGSTELLYDFYHSIARSRKRKGDAEVDKVTKVLLYLDASAYFILSAKHFNAPDAAENRANRQYSIIRDTNDLLK
ncbi:hypothetical protein NECAME_15976 [Necator americanus]|uniref:AF4/FMR2 family member lilli n=1 Tax=Necator americanus TaxID=51031 RepID=W2SF26_NECAM|nr:hypothetical protein NECAME_15976 [Necator americanus]ETN68180.1 hypothetical protein NECAME_15976 [Necator americanus]